LKPITIQRKIYFTKVVEEVVEEQEEYVISDPTFQIRQQKIQAAESYQMELEDFDAGDIGALETLHCDVKRRVIKAKKVKEPLGFKNPSVALEGERNLQDRREARWAYLRAKKGKSTVERIVTPRETYADYLKPEVHGIDPFRRDRVETTVNRKLVKRVVTHDPETQERWQLVANLEMEKVIKYGAKVDRNQRGNQRYVGQRAYIGMKNRRDYHAKRKLDEIKNLLDYDVKIPSALLLAKRKKEKARIKRIEEVAAKRPGLQLPHELVVSYNLRLLFYTLHTLGVRKGVACLTEETMLTYLEAVGRGHKIPIAKHANKKCRVRKRDRKVIRMLLREVIQ
jgi:hypothetical protein